MEFREYATQISEVIRGVGALMLSQKRPEVFVKDGHANFVTSADLACQEYAIEHLKPLIPDAHFFAEEQENNQLYPGFNWVIDPIDGTTNFMRGYQFSCVSIGLIWNREPVLGAVYNPYLDELFLGIKGQGATLNGKPIHVSENELQNGLVIFGTAPYYRDKADETFAIAKRIFLACGDVRRSGSAALELCYVAAGRCDAFYEARLCPWDFTAGSLILQEAGGKIGAIPCGPVDYANPSGIVAANAVVFDEVLSLVTGHN